MIVNGVFGVVVAQEIPLRSLLDDLDVGEPLDLWVESPDMPEATVLTVAEKETAKGLSVDVAALA